MLTNDFETKLNRRQMTLSKFTLLSSPKGLGLEQTLLDQLSSLKIRLHLGQLQEIKRMHVHVPC